MPFFSLTEILLTFHGKLNIMSTTEPSLSNTLPYLHHLIWI